MKVTQHVGRRIAALAVVCGLAVSAQAEIYKWVDENGHVQYGDQPPTGAKTSSVTVHKSAGVSLNESSGVAAKSATTKGKDGNVVKPVYDKEQAAQNCEAANKNLEATSLSTIVKTTDKDGNPQMLSGPQVAEWRQKLEAERDKWCSLAK